jgi:hypothetical protein
MKYFCKSLGLALCLSFGGLTPSIASAQAAAAPAKPAGAQIFQWRDSNGRLVVSDRPPPVDTRSAVQRTDLPPPTASTSGVRLAIPPSADASRAADAAKASAGKAKPSREELEKQAELEARKKESCEAAQTELRTLESGIRIAQVNAQGEREFMSDEARARRLSTVRRDVSESCKG